jgi:hypothetical protein
MTKHKSRFEAKSKHTFAGQAEGEPLVEWLNSKDAGQPRADIAAALTLLREIREEIERTGAKTRWDAVMRPEIIEKANSMQGFLARYTFRPALMPDVDSQVSFRWFPAWTEADQLIMGVRFGRYGPEHAVLGIMRLTEKRLLDRVKQCRCGRWIFAKFPQEQHCSPACRLKAHRSQPNWKERRREWQKGNRVVHKHLDPLEGTMKKRRVQ